MRSLPPPASGHEPSTPDIREATGILRRHRWVLLACPLIGIAVGVGIASLRHPVYEASALILVGDRTSGVTSGQPQSPQEDAQRIGTEMEVLRSRRVAAQVVDSLHLQVGVLEPSDAPRGDIIAAAAVDESVRPGKYKLTRQADGRFRVQDEKSDAVLGTFPVGQPIRMAGARVVLAPGARGRDEIELQVQSRSAAVQALETAVAVKQPSADVNVIRVSYRGTDPELVRDIPNALTARYVSLRESLQKAEARSTTAHLRAQLDTVTRQLALSEDQLRGFRESNRVIDPQMEATSQVSQLAQLQAQRATVDAERSSLQRLYSQVRSAPSTPGSPSPYRQLVGFPALLQNQTASELLRNLNDAESQRAALATRRTAEDPDLQALNARVTAIERQLQSIVTTYLAGLTNQVQALDATLGKQQSQLDALPGKEAQFTRLSRQPRVLQGMYEVLQTRLKEAEIAEAVDDANIRVVDPADLPTEPTGPGMPVFAGASAILALLLGVGIVFAREYADQAVHTRADVQAAIGIPVLGMIPQVKNAMLPRRRSLPRPHTALAPREGDGVQLVETKGSNGFAPALLVPSLGPTPWSDAYNRLHTNIMFAQPDADMKTMLFTSPLPGDGKTSTAVNFAVTLAQSGLKVLLIDADLRRGRVHEIFDASTSPGLSDLLADLPAPGVLRHAELGTGKPLRYIVSGRTPANPVQLLSSTAMRALIEAAEQEYDRVIIDTPPLNLFPDAVALSPMVDGVLVVARAGVTPFDALVDTAEQLRHANTHVVGAVLNGIDFERDASYDTSYRWYQYGKAYAQAPTGA